MLWAKNQVRVAARLKNSWFNLGLIEEVITLILEIKQCGMILHTPRKNWQVAVPPLEE